MIVYKVVAEDYGDRMRLYSWGLLPKAWQRYYKVGETTHPAPGTLLFAFDTEEHARTFMGDGTLPILLRCETEDAQPQKQSAYLGQDIAKFWADGLNTAWTQPTPEGTVGCPWLKVLEEVR